MPQIIIEVTDDNLAYLKKRLEQEDDVKVVHDPLAVLTYMLQTDAGGGGYDSYIEYVLESANCSDGVAAEFSHLGDAIIEVEEQEDEDEG